MAILQCAISPQDALRAGKRLLGQWPHAKPPDPDGFAAAIGAVLAQYPAGLVEECCDPRHGLARSREFPPTVAAVVEWLDKRLAHHRAMAKYRPPAPKPVEQQYSDEHRQSMLQRLSKLMHGLFDNSERHRNYVRPVGRFEQPGDVWNSRRSR